MYKLNRYREKLNVRWSGLDTKYEDKTQTNNSSTSTTTTSSSVADNFNIKSNAILTKSEVAATELELQVTRDKLAANTKTLDETAAETALETARAAVEAAKLAVDVLESSNGKYSNWNNKHVELAALSWCCIGDLIVFCNKYEFRSISRTDARLQQTIVAQVKALLNSEAPFGMRQRFPGNIRNPENLWVCVGRCAGIEYHLNRILSNFRKPLDQLSPDKQRMARQTFHLAVNELHLDITARILDLRLYDRNIFERDFHLTWEGDT